MICVIIISTWIKHNESAYCKIFKSDHIALLLEFNLFNSSIIGYTSSAWVMSDKGFPIICTPKKNTFKINAPALSNASEQNKEALLATIKLIKSKLRLY